jgi:hypothetical protein
MAFVPFAAALAAAAGTSATAAGLMIVGTTAAVAGAGISAYGMIQQGKQQAASISTESNYMASIDETNALRAGQAGVQEQQAAQREVDDLREQKIRLLASQRAQAGGSGLTISGSVVDAMSDSSIQVEKEIQMARYRGEVSAYNYRNEAQDLYKSATFRRKFGATSASNALSSSRWSAAGTAIQGLGSAGFNFASFGKR